MRCPSPARLGSLDSLNTRGLSDHSVFHIDVVPSDGSGEAREEGCPVSKEGTHKLGGATELFSTVVVFRTGAAVCVDKSGNPLLRLNCIMMVQALKSFMSLMGPRWQCLRRGLVLTSAGRIFCLLVVDGDVAIGHRLFSA